MKPLQIYFSIISIFIILMTGPVAVFAQGNPFIKHMYTADPSAHVWADGRLYVYASHDIAPARGCDLMDEYHVFSTDDMVNWVDHGEILRASQVPWGKPLQNDGKFMWAPDCAYKDGTYYFYFPHPSEDPWNKTWKIGVAASKKPASDFKVIGYITNAEPHIDPCVFVDDDGQAYFYQGGGGVCKGGKLKKNMMEIDGPLKVMEGLEDFHEATWVHKRNGIYYLSYSDNHDEGNDKEGVKGDNRMRYATAKSPLGPWKYQGIYMDPTDSYTNHGSIVEYKGQWYAFYHNSRLSKQNGEPNDWLRSICVDKLYYNPDGTIQKVVQTDDKLRAGTAKTNITPAKPEKKNVHDSLYARSLILDCRGTRIAFISFDLGGYTNPSLLNDLKKKYQLDELYFCPSHTHSGALDKDNIEAKLTSVLDEASKNMFEARISGGHRTTPQLTFNRLIVRDNGHAREAWYADPEGHYRYLNTERIPFGPVDSSVGVLRIEDEKGNPRALIMNFACHPDALVALPSVVSADFAGYATQYTEAAFDNKVNCLFIQGGAGNQCSLFKTPTDGTTPEAYYSMVERMGKLLGIETVALAKELFPNPNEKPSLRLITDSLDLPNRFDKDVAKIKFSTILLDDRYAIATFPGEPFIKFQLDWKREMGPYAEPFFFGYTWNGGGWPTYVPDVRSAALGGYGADWGPVRAPGGGEAVMTKHLYNYYVIKGLMRTEQGPGDHRMDDGTVVWKPDWMTPDEQTAADASFDIFKTLDKKKIAYTVSDFAGYPCATFQQYGRECKIVKPRKTAANHPWIWRARFFGHEPQTDLALLERGYHLVYCDQAERMGNKKCIREWDSFYQLLREGGLNQKAVLEGMSRGAVYVFNWAAANPQKVAAVYVDNPLLDMKAMYFGPDGKEKPENEITTGIRDNWGIDRSQIKTFNESPIDKIDAIVKGKYPILIICAELDEAAVNSQNTFPFEKKIKEKGGNITVIVKKGAKHHPHSLPDPAPIVEFIETAVNANK